MKIKTIKAAILVEQNQPLVVDEIELPDKLDFGQILVQIHYSGICGSQVGEIDGVKGPVKTTAVAPTFLDVALRSGSSEIALGSDEAAFIYVYEGSVVINSGELSKETIVSQGELGVLSQSGKQLSVSADTGCKFIVVSGKPIEEPVVQYGPFVMNTQQEIIQAFKDYEQGRMGKII